MLTYVFKCKVLRSFTEKCDYDNDDCLDEQTFYIIFAGEIKDQMEQGWRSG